MKPTITLQELATKLNGKFWSKDGKERVYLDRGYNTKKMSTKTYVEVRNDEFSVRCFIDCPSQNNNWIDSQKQEVIDSVNDQIEQIIRVSTLELVEFKEEKEEFIVLVSENKQESKWYTEDEFYNEFSDYPEYIFESLPKKEYKAVSFEPKKTIDVSKITIFSNNKDIKKVDTYGVDTKVSHARFGLGIVVSECETKVEVLFENEEFGKKPLLKAFANLQLV